MQASASASQSSRASPKHTTEPSPSPPGPPAGSASRCNYPPAISGSTRLLPPVRYRGDVDERIDVGARHGEDDTANPHRLAVDVDGVAYARDLVNAANVVDGDVGEHGD